MARPLRVEFAGAVYHVTSRGNGRRDIVTHDDDRARLLRAIEETVVRFDWELFAFVLMTNHLHLFFRTPRPNLSHGMQTLLSGYANWFRTRRRRTGHLFQGRFQAKLVEDESYFWTVSRYVHLNPLRTRTPLAAHPRDWPWSSYPGYADRRRRLSFVADDTLLSAWAGECGGSDPRRAYRRFVEQEISEAPEDPFAQAKGGWILGSAAFAQQIRGRVEQSEAGADPPPQRQQLNQLTGLSLAEVLRETAVFYDVSETVFGRKRRGGFPRLAGAWLARRLTSATLLEMAPLFGLTHPGSVSNLTRRVEAASTSPSIRQELADLEDHVRSLTTASPAP